MKQLKFYYQDLNNYTSEFLQEIILWQKEKIEESKRCFDELYGEAVKEKERLEGEITKLNKSS